MGWQEFCDLPKDPDSTAWLGWFESTAEYHTLLRVYRDSGVVKCLPDCVINVRRACISANETFQPRARLFNLVWEVNSIAGQDEGLKGDLVRTFLRLASAGPQQPGASHASRWLQWFMQNYPTEYDIIARTVYESEC